MFWSRARATYAPVAPDDSDVQRYLQISEEIQNHNYGGLTGWVQDMGHRWIAGRTPPGRVLEVGHGAGRHRQFFAGDFSQYFATEYVAETSKALAHEHVRERAARCDARKLPFRDQSFDAVISVYNLEHIPELQTVCDEAWRVLKRGGRFLVGLPCEGGFAYNFGRELVTRRQFMRKYALNYDKLIAYEHVWDLRGILRELRRFGRFRMRAEVMLPLRVPMIDLNLIACFDLQREG